MFTQSERDEFIGGYVQAAVWADLMPASSDPDHPDYEEGWESGGPTDATIDDFDDDSQLRIVGDCNRFLADNGYQLLLYCERRAYNPGEGTGLQHAGHDLWLSQHRHGTGFWDRGAGVVGDRLDKAAHKLSEDVAPYELPDGSYIME